MFFGKQEISYCSACWSSDTVQWAALTHAPFLSLFFQSSMASSLFVLEVIQPSRYFDRKRRASLSVAPEEKLLSATLPLAGGGEIPMNQ